MLKHFKALPRAFSEHGAIQAANVLNSARAVEMSVFVVRAFVKMREHLAARDDMARRLYQIERQLLRHDASPQEVYREIRALRQTGVASPERQIGFARGDQE